MTDGDSNVGSARWKYGLIALIIGAVTIVLTLLIVGLVWDQDANALAATTGAVGTIVGAYFGLQVGGAESENAKKERDDAKKERDQAMKATHAFCAKLPEAESAPVLQNYGLM